LNATLWNYRAVTRLAVGQYFMASPEEKSLWLFSPVSFTVDQWAVMISSNSINVENIVG